MAGLRDGEIVFERAAAVGDELMMARAGRIFKLHDHIDPTFSRHTFEVFGDFRIGGKGRGSQGEREGPDTCCPREQGIAGPEFPAVSEIYCLFHFVCLPVFVIR
jgi:hypothetical protein